MSRFINPARRSEIASIVGRYHVSFSNRDVVRDMYCRAKRAKRIGKPLTRAQRKAIYREAIAIHARNRALYGRVMRGAR